jgi:CDP-4-dehydro-6-deoxyglucose reductase
MFSIQNQTSGNVFQIDANTSLLDGALNASLGFPYGCQNGFCGKCKATLLQGEVSYINAKSPGITAEEVAKNQILLCQCLAKTDVVLAIEEIGKMADLKVQNLPCKVHSLTRLNDDVMCLVLKTPKATPLEYLAGQYIDIIHPDFSPKSFSIANAPQDNALIEVHIRLINEGAFTQFVFNDLTEKSLLRIEGAKGSFYLREMSDKPIIMIAGGTGLGPIKALIERLIQLKSNRKILLYWGVRTEKDLYTNAPNQWHTEYKNFSFTPVLSEPDTNWQGRVGFVHECVLADINDFSTYEVYACGPPIMVESSGKAMVKKGLLKCNFFSDSFEFNHTEKDHE